MFSFENWIDFRRNENPKACKVFCIDCGKPAEGNVSCDEGEICDACHEKDMINDEIFENSQPF